MTSISDKSIDPKIKQSTEITQMENPVPVHGSIQEFRDRQKYNPRTPSPLGLSNIDISDDEEDLQAYTEKQGKNDTGDETEESRGTSLNTINANLSKYNNIVTSRSDKIPLFIHGDHVLIFNAKDMKELTIKYGITGQLSGILPLAPQQNLLLGFPLRLSIYEVLWCLYLDVGYLVDSSDVVNDMLLKDWKDDVEFQEKMIDELNLKLDKWREEKQREIDEQMKKLNIIKRDSKKIEAGALLSSTSMPDLNQLGESREKELQEKKKRDREIEEKSKRNKIVFMETPTNDTKLEEYMKQIEVSDQFQLIKKLIDNEVEDYFDIWINFKMFKYLIKQFNYQMLPGMRFGGTFVAYPGDPLRYHAHQIVETKRYYTEDIGLFKMCNRGRLATGVRKVWVVSGTPNEDLFSFQNVSNDAELQELIIDQNDDEDDMNDMVSFSIEWAGF